MNWLRLLRWYPKSWREEHGAVLAGILADAAAANGRSTLSSGELWQLRLAGLGERLTLRFAAVVGLFATVLGAVVTWLIVVGDLNPWLSPLLLGLATVAAGLGALALGKCGRLLDGARAVVVGLVSLPAWGLGALAGLSWGIGFRQADLDQPLSPFAAAFVWLALVAWILGTLAWALAFEPLFTTLSRAGRRVASVLLAAGASAVTGTAAANGGMVLAAGLVVLVLAAIMGAPTASDRPIEAVAARAVNRRAIGAAAVVTLVGVVPAVVVAWLGEPIGFDPDRAIQIGLGVGALMVIPMLAVLAWQVLVPTARIGAGLAMAGLAVHGVQAAMGLFASGDYPWLTMELMAIGLAGAVFCQIRRGFVVRAAMAFTALVGWAAFGWIPVTALAILALPVSVVVAVWGLRRPRLAKAVPA